MMLPPQLIVVETLFPSTSSRRASYVLVQAKVPVEVEKTPAEDAAAFALGFGRPASVADAAAIFVFSRHDDTEAAYHATREGMLFEAEDVMKRPPDEETEAVQMWLVAET